MHLVGAFRSSLKCMNAKSTESSCSALSRRTLSRQDDKANTDPRALFSGVEYRIFTAHGAWHGRGALAVDNCEPHYG